MGLDSNYLKLLSAVVVAIFLAVPYWKKKYFSGAKYAEKRAERASRKMNAHAKEGGSENA